MHKIRFDFTVFLIIRGGIWFREKSFSEKFSFTHRFRMRLLQLKKFILETWIMM